MSTPTEPVRTPTAVGRIGDPALGPATDPRTNPSLRQALIGFGLGEAFVSDDRARPADPRLIESAVRQAHEDEEAWYASVPMALPGDDDIHISRTTRSATSADGHEIVLEIYRPEDREGVLPCVVHLHGGAMVILSTRNRIHDRWCLDLAAQGAVVVQVDFRNAWTPTGLNPFPAGLSDCVAAISWVHAHRTELGVGPVVVQGESGWGEPRTRVGPAGRAGRHTPDDRRGVRQGTVHQRCLRMGPAGRHP